jgi:hypothetical protein
MASIISCSIDVSKIDKSKLVGGKNGAKYFNFDITVNDNADQYGNHAAISNKQTKEQRQAKEKKTYLGNGKIVWQSAPQSVAIVPGQDYTVSQSSTDDLPF